jgi:hypothetical protein
MLQHYNAIFLQVRAAYSESTRLARNNFALIKAFLGTWRGLVPLRARDLLFHLSAMPKSSQARPSGSAIHHSSPGQGATKPDATAIATALMQRAFGMKLLAAGDPRPRAHIFSYNTPVVTVDTSI